jgi:hypothetical protein
MEIYIIIILCIIFYLLFVTEGFVGEPALKQYQAADIIDYSKFINRDQNNQSISKYTNINTCKLECDNNNMCAGMVVNGKDCWTIKSFPSPYPRQNSTTYVKSGQCSTTALCNSTINTRIRERDDCNTNLSSTQDELSTCKNNLSSTREELSTCNNSLTSSDLRLYQIRNGIENLFNERGIKTNGLNVMQAAVMPSDWTDGVSNK